MDEKEIDLKIEKEMVDLFIISNRKDVFVHLIYLALV